MFREIFDSVDHGFCVVEVIFDEEGRAVDYVFLETNSAFERNTGLADAVGKRMRTLRPGHEEHWFEIYGRIARTGQPERFENFAQALGRWYSVYAFRTGAPELCRVAIMFDDISARKEAEQERGRAEAASLAKSKFLAAASHDLRQPIQSLMLFSQVLTLKLADHPVREVVVKMSTALDTLKELLDSLLDLSKLDAGLVTPEVRPHSMAVLVRELADVYQPRMAAKGLRFKTRLGDDWALIDPTLVRRILSNFLDNALKYTRQGGVLLAQRRIGDRVRIDVVDTGVGISQHHLDRIFDEFVQVGEAGREHHQGMGLGLATVKRLVDLLGYELSVRSRPEAWSCFTLFVPVAVASADVAGGVKHVYRGAHPCRVLVVDDDQTIVEGMRALLETNGYRVVSATSAEEALTVIDNSTPPDAVLADYRLGGSITGMNLIELARERIGRDIPAIVITGDMGVRSRSSITVLHKPIAPAMLTETLAEVCSGGGRSSM